MYFFTVKGQPGRIEMPRPVAAGRGPLSDTMPKTKSPRSFPKAGDGLTPHDTDQLTMTNDHPEPWRLEGVPVVITLPQTDDPAGVIHKPSGSCWLTEKDLTILRARLEPWTPSDREWALISGARAGKYDGRAVQKDLGPLSWALMRIQKANQRRQHFEGNPTRSPMHQHYQPEPSEAGVGA